MNKSKWIRLLVGVAAVAGGLITALLTRAGAIAQGAAFTDKLPFVLGLILLVLGLVVLVAGLLPARRSPDIRTLTTTAMFAALCYVGFTFFKIDIPVGESSTAFHLGNVFCVLGALCIGGLWGGLAGSIGMTIGDLMSPVYITSAPKTFVLKLGIGLIAGFVAHRIFAISQDRPRRVPLAAAAALSCTAGMAFNVVADPLVGYFYKLYVLGVPQDAASIWAKMGAVTTFVNAVIAVVAATVFYLALRPALKRTGLLQKM